MRLYWDGEDWVTERPVRKVENRSGLQCPMIQSDAEGFWEPGGNAQNGGQFIDGRKDIRAYEKANGVRQVGNDIPLAPPTGES